MNELKVFENVEFGNVRVIEKNGVLWFVGKDVADALGYQNTRDAISTHVDSDDKAEVAIHDGSQNRNMTVINESGLYSMIVSSRLPAAKQFKRWVTSEVLPSIRKNGIYATEVTVEKMLSDPDFAIELLTTLKEERAKRLEVEKTNTILMHVTKNYTATEIAKELGFKSATELNKILSQMKVQYKQNETWVLYSKYADRGYTDIKQQVLDSGKVVYDRKWTQLGRKFLLELFSEQTALD